MAGMIQRAAAKVVRWAAGKSWEELHEIILRQQSGTTGVWRNLSAAEKERVQRNSAVVYACVRKITTAFAEGRLVVGVENDEGGFNELPGDPLWQLMKAPNRELSQPQYQSLTLSALLLTGESYSMQVRGPREETASLVPVPTSWVTQRRNADGQLMYYEVTWGTGRVLTVMPVDMMRIWWPDPSDPTSALGPLQAALRSYETDDERESWTYEMLGNMHLPGLILSQREAWTDEQMRAAREKVRDAAGPGKRGGPLFTWGESADVKVLSPPNDIDLQGLANLSETRICACFGVPPQVLGLRSGEIGKTYANYEEANRAFYRQTIVPIGRDLATQQTYALVTDEGDESGKEIRYDFSEVKELQDDATALSARVVTEWAQGLRTRGESRALLGLLPLGPAMDDVIAMPINLVEMATDGSTEPEPDDEIQHTQPWPEGEEQPNGEEA